jgi:hypothetical protein
METKIVTLQTNGSARAALLRGLTTAAAGRTGVSGLRVQTHIKAGPNGCTGCRQTSQ